MNDDGLIFKLFVPEQFKSSPPFLKLEFSTMLIKGPFIPPVQVSEIYDFMFVDGDCITNFTISDGKNEFIIFVFI